VPINSIGNNLKKIPKITKQLLSGRFFQGVIAKILPMEKLTFCALAQCREILPQILSNLVYKGIEFKED
jgi:hypothetical protein